MKIWNLKHIFLRITSNIKKIKEYDEKYSDIEKEIEKYYIDKCKNDNEQYVSIEDIDRLINGMYLSDDSKKELGIIKRYLEKLIIIIERSNWCWRWRKNKFSKS